MKIKIRDGIKEDLPAILELIKELADFENAKEQVTITLEDLEKDGFGKNPSYWFLVAEKDNEIIGLSFYWIRYSTWKGKFLFLEDFVIKKKYKRQGIGSKLFEETINITGIHDIASSSRRTLIKITDVLGRATKGTRNKALLYIYNDGTVEKRIVIE